MISISPLASFFSEQKKLKIHKRKVKNMKCGDLNREKMKPTSWFHSLIKVTASPGPIILCKIMDYFPSVTHRHTHSPCPPSPAPPLSSVHGISQIRMLEWVAISSSRGSTPPRDQTHISFIGRWILYPLSHLGSPGEQVTVH